MYAGLIVVVLLCFRDEFALVCIPIGLVLGLIVMLWVVLLFVWVVALFNLVLIC